jgi:hypothetical protein
MDPIGLGKGCSPIRDNKDSGENAGLTNRTKAKQKLRLAQYFMTPRENSPIDKFSKKLKMVSKHPIKTQIEGG